MLWGTISSDQKMWVRLFAAGVTAAVAAMALTYMLSIIQKPHENPPDAAVVAANIKADKIRMRDVGLGYLMRYWLTCLWLNHNLT